MKHGLFACIIFLLFQVLQSQERWIEMDGGYGYTVPHHKDMQYYLREHAYRISGTYLQKRASSLINGSNIRKGLSVVYIHAGDKAMVGDAWCLTHVLRYPLLKRFSLFLETRVGLTYSSRTYSKDNYFFNAIGSHFNAMIDVALIKQFSFPVVQPYIHLSWNHYSNGAIKMPNLGINVPVFGVGVAYRMTSFSDTTVYYELPVKPHRDVFILGSIIQRSIDGPYSPVFTFCYNEILAAKKSYHWRAGIDVIMDWGIQDNSKLYPQVKGNSWDILKIGYHLGWVYAVGKLEVDLALGSYIKNINFSKEMMFERLAYRYFMTNSWGLQVGLRAHFAKADVIEIGCVWRVSEK